MQRLTEPMPPGIKAQDSDISATDPDWSREDIAQGWTTGRALLNAIRTYQKHQVRSDPMSRLFRKIAVARYVYWSAITGADIPLNCRIGGGLLLPHPNGIVIHSNACIGPNCLIFQQVTIGASTKGVPTIGGHVDIGAGAKIIGPVVIGDHVRIGANALVHFDVPTGSVVAAPAASILTRKKTPCDGLKAE